MTPNINSMSFLWVIGCSWNFNHTKKCLLQHKKNYKLSPWFYGSFWILERIGKVAYKLGLPSYSRLDLVFHVLVLKKKIGEEKMVFKDLPTLNDGKEFKSLPQVVLGWRLKKRNIKVLIHWQWLSLFEAMWEDCNGIKLCFLRWRLKLCFLSRTCVGIFFLYVIFELM